MTYNVHIMKKAEEDLSSINNYIALYLINDDKKEVSIMRIFYAKRDYGNLI